MSTPKVGIVMGSRSDWSGVMEHCAATLEKLGVPHDVRVASAHRTPDALEEWIAGCEEAGVQVYISAAGGAAHLGGVVASKTAKPVLGVPMLSKGLGGMDSLLSMVQMPAGVPVPTLAIGKPGAINAALAAAQIVALSDPAIAAAVTEFRAAQSAKVIADPDPRLDPPA